MLFWCRAYIVLFRFNTLVDGNTRCQKPEPVLSMRHDIYI